MYVLLYHLLYDVIKTFPYVCILFDLKSKFMVASLQISLITKAQVLQLNTFA